MKAQTRPFDWAELRKYIRLIEERGAQSTTKTIPANSETKRYIRLQRYVHRRARSRNPNVLRDAMIYLALEFKLSPMQARSLYVRLQDLSSRYRFGRELETLSRAGSYVKPLKRIRKSLDMLSKFSNDVLTEADATHRIVDTHLENAAHFWAKDIHDASNSPGNYHLWEDGAKPHGFEISKDESLGYPVVNFGSYQVLRTWLRSNILFSRLVAEIIEKEARKAKTPVMMGAVNFDDHSVIDVIRHSSEPTEIVRLAGIELPKLFTQYTGRVYGFSQLHAGGLSLVAGPKFATMCFPVMGLPTLGLEVLRTHWKTATGKA